MESSSTRDFTRRWLPWIVGAAMLVVYGTTLNRDITVGSLMPLSRIAGWNWQPTYNYPLFYLLSLPVRWVPAGWQLLVGNLLFAVLGALTLVQLARSVSLLPHDRTREQRARESNDQGLLTIPLAWLPPVIAVLGCGLQINFWENSLVATGETLDVLIFAYVIRCLLEFRLDQREGWLYRMGLVYGLGITNNAAMIPFFPALLAALLWIRGRDFFRWRFQLKWGGCLVAGLLMYCVLPAIVAASGTTEVGFIGALRTQLANQKAVLRMIPVPTMLMMAGPMLLPIILMGIRWPSSFGDSSGAGVRLATLLTHVLFAGAIALSVLMLIDWRISPRATFPLFGFLPLYYLSALALGYYSGYFLLVFAPRRSGSGRRRESGMIAALRFGITGAVCLGAAALPAALLWRNFPVVREQNTKDLAGYARRLADSVIQAAPGGAVLLSDDSGRLFAVYAILNERQRQQYVLLNTSDLPDRLYHQYLRRRYGNALPLIATTEGGQQFFNQASLIQMLQQIARQDQRIFYLHPSFGYYFEQFHLRPRGLAGELVAFSTNSIVAPGLTAQEAREELAWWQATDQEYTGPIKQRLAGEPANSVERSLTNLRQVGRFYSLSLNQLGVLLQRSGDTTNALWCFDEAIALNDGNASAWLNREFALHWAKEHKAIPMFSDDTAKRVSSYLPHKGWEQMLADCGPLEEPDMCRALSDIFANAGLPRQSLQQTVRYLFYFPNDIVARIGLVQRTLMCGLADECLAQSAKVRREVNNLAIEHDLTLASLEAWASYFKDDIAQADKILTAAQQRHPSREEGYFQLMRIYAIQAETLNRAGGDISMAASAYTNALRVLDRQIKAQPRNAVAWSGIGAIWIQLQDFQAALKALNQAIAINPTHELALFNRAYVNLKLEQWDAARRDYRDLVRGGAAMPAITFGLAEIAYQKKEWAEATEQYKAFLENGIPGSPEVTRAKDRLKELDLKGIPGK